MTVCNTRGHHAENSWAEYDGYGIYLARVCDDCVEEVMAGFRPDIKDRYEADEPIEPEEPSVDWSESDEGYEARERWARAYDELDGAPEGDWDR